MEDWDEPPTYDRNPDGSIRTWDFYGGSLKGIEGDLPRLADLGITVIYLNPIFEAASNHRYDTSDYLKIDPVLGTEEDFRHLCAEAKKRGISIILDGVFNHTGDDSVYFNRYGNYPDVGAWQSPESPWRDAYRFHEDGTYDCWWGISNMPALNEDSPKVKELILGEHGVVRTWLRAGARGWRLDVADELKEEMIAGIKQATLEERPDGVVIGEVWEDASNKVSYGHLRHYLLGDELDSAMNYPFRDMVLGFLLGTKDAAEAVEDIESLSGRGTQLRAQPAGQPRSPAHRERAGRRSRQEQASRERARALASGRGVHGARQGPLLAGHAHADDLPGRALHLLR